MLNVRCRIGGAEGGLRQSVGVGRWTPVVGGPDSVSTKPYGCPFYSRGLASERFVSPAGYPRRAKGLKGSVRRILLGYYETRYEVQGSVTYRERLGTQGRIESVATSLRCDDDDF